ncbi:MAG: sigma-70 family RNA polymerase sigma factor [Armatimonadota bacterium]
MSLREDAYIDSLWRAYKNYGSLEARRKLILHYLPMAKRIVGQLDLRPTGAAGMEDLASHAIVGLISAVDSFDPKIGVRFTSYAAARVRGEVLDALRRMDWLPRTTRQQISALREALAALEAKLGRHPSDAEICDYTGLTNEEYENLLQAESMSSLLSLDASSALHEEHQREREVPDFNAENPAAYVERNERREAVAKAIAELPERERLVLALYYDEELTFKEIGKILGVSEARVCQIHGRAILRLKTRLKSMVEAVV